MLESERAQTGLDVADAELQHRLDQLRLLLDVNNSIVSHLDLRELFKVISECLGRVTNYDAVGMTLYDEEADKLRVYVLESRLTQAPSVSEGVLISIADTPAGRAFTLRQTVMFSRPDLEKFSSPLLQRALADGLRCSCVAPLISHGRALGTLAIASLRDNAFTQADAELLTQIANQIAIAVENALNYEAVRAAEQQMARDRERANLLLEINNTIASSLDLRELFTAISACLRTVLHHDYADLGLYDAETNQMRLCAIDKGDGVQLGEENVWWPVEGTPAGLAIRLRQTIVRERRDPAELPSELMDSAFDAGLRSGCAVPLIVRDRVLGVLIVASRREAAFTAEDGELLTQIGVQVALAVENALNFENTRRAEQLAERDRDRLQLLLEVNNATVSHLDLRDLMKAISAKLRDVIHHDLTGLALYDPETKGFRAHALDYAFGVNLPPEGTLFPIEGSPSGLAFTLGQPVYMPRPDPEKFPSPFLRRFTEIGLKSLCGVPLVAHGRALGVLIVMSLREEAFTAGDRELLAQIANQVAIAVENSLNYEAVRKAEAQMPHDRDRLRLLLEVNNAIVSRRDLRELIHAISADLHDNLQHDMIGLSLYDPEINQLRTYTYDFADQKPFLEEGYPIPLEGTFTGLAFTSGKPVFMNIESSIFHSDFNKRFREAGFKSGGCVPLTVHGRRIGTLGVTSFSEHIYSEDEAELLCQVANQVAIALENLLAYREIEALKNKLSEEKLYLEEEIHTAYNFDQIIGSSAAFKRILKQVETVAPTDSTVLIQGETGTGKEIIARAIHNISARKARTLVKLNCAAIPTGLLEAELFGHEKGAFTGAIAQRIGRFELAHKGTLFLDEVGEIPLELQPKLLRVLQEREFERLGSTRTSKVDVRLIAATNRALEQMVGERRFRDDLYYRLNVFPITIPPLRERREDIPLLVRFFASRFARRMNKRIETIPVEAVIALQDYHWPGNIRELENFIERAVIVTRDKELQIPLAEMKPPVQAVASTAAHSTSASIPSAGAIESASLESIERDHIVRVLNETNWVVSGPEGAAARLGLKRTTLQARMKKLGIARHHTAP